jgi:hypothetical protein
VADSVSVAGYGRSSRSWKSKLKSTSAEAGAIRTWSMVDVGMAGNVSAREGIGKRPSSSVGARV